MRRGWTIAEILVVLVIIALLVVLLLPVVYNSLRRSKEVPCTAQMRQIYVAWRTYYDDYKEVPSLVALYQQAQQVFVCPLDSYERGANPVVRSLTGHKGSYYYLDTSGVINEMDRMFMKALESVDMNHGIVACVLHGEVVPEYETPLIRHKGVVLRLRRDVSIQRARRTAYCGEHRRGRCLWDLMTDDRTSPKRQDYCHSEGLLPCD
ncbi:MAG: hypothetical protein C4337_10475 [Armatimonadota bacterium]